jgi:hypothetical protein
MIWILNVKQFQIWKTEYVYVGRSAPNNAMFAVRQESPLANPFVIGKDGDRKQVIEKYRKWLWEQCKIPQSTAKRELDRLVEKYKRGESIVLVCWCAPKRCHADIIKRAIEHFAKGNRSG